MNQYFLAVVLAAMILVDDGLAQRSTRVAAPPSSPLFQQTHISEVHLEFTKADYDALRPRGGGWFGSGGGGSAQSWLQGPEGKRNGFAASRGVQFSYVHGNVSVNGQTLRDVGVRYKGNGTYFEGAAKGKVSLKLDFNEYVKGQKLGTLKKLNLHSNITDASSMNEVLAFQLFRDAGVPAPRTSYARVYVSIQGQKQHAYAGLFSIVENPDEQFIAARGLPPSGAIFKPVASQLFADLGPDWTRYNQTYDPKTTLSDAQKQRVIDFARLVSGGTDAQFAARVGEFLDLEETARYLAVVVFLSDLDGLLGPGQNYYLYLDPRTQKFSFIAWDQDHSFGQFFRGTQSAREQLSIHHPWSESSRFLERLFRVDAFKKLYLTRLTEFSATLFKPERFHRQVDELAVVIRPAIKEESDQRLLRFDRAVAGEVPPGDAGMFRGANIPIKPFVKTRAQSVIDQLAGRSMGQRIGGRF
ncbi:MAG TPA: CotH kinase family protein [Vicinamibacterales bacterium]|nr:CotH kinase family protein [Vicinamibacterales bacterium]